MMKPGAYVRVSVPMQFQSAEDIIVLEPGTRMRVERSYTDEEGHEQLVLRLESPCPECNEKHDIGPFEPVPRENVEVEH